MNTLFQQPLNVVNAGLNSFADNLALAGGDVIDLRWQPPALGDADAGLALASLIRHPLIDQANEQAFQQYLAAQPVLVDVMSASHAIGASQADPAFGATHRLGRHVRTGEGRNRRRDPV